MAGKPVRTTCSTFSELAEIELGRILHCLLSWSGHNFALKNAGLVTAASVFSRLISLISRNNCSLYAGSLKKELSVFLVQVFQAGCPSCH